MTVVKVVKTQRKPDRQNKTKLKKTKLNS